jgi:carbamoyltransferase
VSAKTIAGIGGVLREPACCIVRDGKLIAAVEQAKVARAQHLGWFPEEAFAEVLKIAGITASDVDTLALARPFAESQESSRLLALRSRFPASRIAVVEHHTAHAASAYYASGFDRAAVLSIDRAGDFRSAVLFEGDGARLHPVRELYFPDSLGDLFNRVTALLGYEPRSDEHKVQWLSASGTPRYLSLFESIIYKGEAKRDWPDFDRSYFEAESVQAGGFSRRFFEALGTSELTAECKADLAASLQEAVNRAVAAMFGSAKQVCIAGGLALNALLVRSLAQRFERVFVQPASSNSGTALGAAFLQAHAPVRFETLCLGPSYSPEEIKRVLENCKLQFRYLMTDTELIRAAVEALEQQGIVGWMQGAMEFGPRALGNRSILASPTDPYSTENLNSYIKHREPFRKFAASVPEEHASEYFEVDGNARFLATVGCVKPKHRRVLAGAILANDLIRVHTVSRDENPLFHELLTAAGKRTGLPVLFNTSFNLFGDPLVCTARDAVRGFYSSGIDKLFVGPFLVEK